MDSNDLKEILRKHKIWINDNNDKEGKKADLSGADLIGADLRRAEGIIFIQSSYPYLSYGFKHKNKNYVRLGCYCRTIEEWDADFNNNPNEFPEGSPQLAVRKFIYECMKNWLINNY
jgi:hypothetical protein